jgi:nucleoid-associated protein YgaU
LQSATLLILGCMMKKPIAIFTSIAALAAAALGGTVYYSKTVAVPAPAITTAAAPKAVEVAPVAEAPAKVAEETAVALVTPAPVVKAPKPKVILPSFDTVRVEASGDAVIAGRAEPDADVTVKLNGDVVGSAKTNADGSFVVVPAKPLAKGTGALTLEVSKNGAVTQSEGSVIVAVKDNAPALVAKIDPVAPTQVVQTGAPAQAPKEVQLTAVDYDAAGNIVFSGTAAPGSIVRFYVDNLSVGEGHADAAGGWSFKGAEMVTPGSHSLRADAVDAAGKVVSRIELPFLREEIAKVAAAHVLEAAPKTAAEVPAAPKTEPDKQVAVAPVVAIVEEGPKTLVIQPGNSLWKLSREVYGKGRMFTIIYEANRDQLKNPNKIFPGQILTAPKQN